MDFSIVIQALQFIAYFSFIIIAALFVGSLLASFIRIVIQVDDQLVNFACKFLALVACFYLGADYFSRELMSFSQAVWQDGSYYF